MSLPIRIKEFASSSEVKRWLAETNEGVSFYPCEYNFLVLMESLDHDLPVTQAKLSKHFRKRQQQGCAFTEEAETARVNKELEQSAASQKAAQEAERTKIYNSPAAIAQRRAERIALDDAEEKRIIAGFWKPIGNEDSHSVLIRATAETENYRRRKLGFPER
jgi:hypothetical protein